MDAERLIAAVAGAYYGDEGRGTRDALTPVMELVERTAPGVVALSKRDSNPGFELSLAERLFPREQEPELRRLAAETLRALPDAPRPAAPAPPPAAQPASRAPRPGFLQRMLAAIQRLFGA
jgi:hypothetical protein